MSLSCDYSSAKGELICIHAFRCMHDRMCSEYAFDSVGVMGSSNFTHCILWISQGSYESLRVQNQFGGVPTAQHTVNKIKIACRSR